MSTNRKHPVELRERATELAAEARKNLETERGAIPRAGEHVAKSTVRRLMKELGLRGASRAKGPRTTRPTPETERPVDLVNRAFTATRPNELWVADITYVRGGFQRSSSTCTLA